MGTSQEFVYLGGRKLVFTPGAYWGVIEGSDRLGSAVEHLPYGEEVSGTAQSRTKFATYWRDESGFDYADQRYYTPGSGRFLSADPYSGSVSTSMPTSWNHYGYVGGDPINRTDTEGRCDAFITGITMGAGSSKNLVEFASSNGMMVSYPYSGTSAGEGVASVYGQSLGIEDAATEAAYFALWAAASDDDGPIHVFTFSGGAQAFMSALKLLPAAIQSRVANITYISPGAGYGPLATGTGQTTILLGSNLVDDMLSTLLEFPDGAQLLTTTCGHDLDCQIRKAEQDLQNLLGNKCKTPQVFTSYFSNDSPTAPSNLNFEIDARRTYANMQFAVQWLVWRSFERWSRTEQVWSVITPGVDQ